MAASRPIWTRTGPASCSGPSKTPISVQFRARKSIVSSRNRCLKMSENRFLKMLQSKIFAAITWSLFPTDSDPKGAKIGFYDPKTPEIESKIVKIGAL